MSAKDQNKTSEAKTKIFTPVLFAILSIFYLGGANSWTHALYQPLVDALGVDYSAMLYVFASIPAAFSMIFSIVAGFLCGRFVSYKVMAIVSLVLFSFGGMIPIVVPTWEALIVSRVVYGLGCGLMTPLAQALTMLYFKGDDNTRVQGWGVVLIKVGNIVSATIAGILVTSMAWNYATAVYAFGIVALVLCLFFLPYDKIDKERKDAEAAQRKQRQAEKARDKFPVWCYCWPLIIFVGYMFYMPFLMNVSGVVVGNGWGDANAAVLCTNVSNVTGIVAGLILGNLGKSLGKYLEPVMFAIAAIGMFVMGYGYSYATTLVGAAIAGFGFNCITAMTLGEAARHIPEAQGGFISGLSLGLVNLAGTIVPFVMEWEYSLFGTNDQTLPWRIGAWGFVVLAAVIFFFQWRNKKDRRGLFAK